MSSCYVCNDCCSSLSSRYRWRKNVPPTSNLSDEPERGGKFLLCLWLLEVPYSHTSPWMAFSHLFNILPEYFPQLVCCCLSAAGKQMLGPCLSWRCLLFVCLYFGEAGCPETSAFWNKKEKSWFCKLISFPSVISTKHKRSSYSIFSTSSNILLFKFLRFV